jgi:hypothetical protein
MYVNPRAIYALRSLLETRPAKFGDSPPLEDLHQDDARDIYLERYEIEKIARRNSRLDPSTMVLNWPVKQIRQAESECT